MKKGVMYKYIHLLWLDEIKFAPRVVAMINDPDAGFNVDDHLFVTPHKKVYQALAGYRNIILDESGENLYNKYGPVAGALFSHGSSDLKTLLTAKRRFVGKTVWRNFGGNRTIVKYNSSFIRNIFHFFLNCTTRLWFNYRFGRFGAIGISNFIDEVDIRKINKRIPLVYMNYPQRRDQYVLNEDNKYSGQSCNILLGHRGTAGEHHIPILKMLQKYRNCHPRIYIIVSYGNKSYINELRNEIGQQDFGDVELVDQFMPEKEYLEFLSKMDVAILDEVRSSAIGCLSRLLRFRKKIFLNSDGIIREAFDRDGLPYCCTKDIPQMSFEEFTRPLVYPSSPEGHRLLHSGNYEEGVQLWHKLLFFADKFTIRQ